MRSRSFLALASCLGVTACDRVFGLDRGDADRVTGTYLARTLHENASGEPVTADEPFTPADVSIEVRFEDGTQLPVEIDDDGSFGFDTPGSDALYTLTASTPLTTVYQTRARQLTLVEEQPGPLVRDPAPAGTRLQMKVDNRAVTPSLELVATSGVWSQATVVGGTPIDLDVRSLKTALGDEAGLLDGATVYYLSYAQAPPGGPFQCLAQAARVPAVTTPPAGVTALYAIAENLSLESCVHINSNINTELSRVRALAPTFSWGGGTLFELSAVPDPTFPVSIGFALVTEVRPAVTQDEDIPAVAYSNPFAGHTVLARMEVNGARAFGGAFLISQSQTIERVPADCSTPLVLGPAAAALPIAISLAGTRLDQDSQVVDIDRSKDLEITWTPTDGLVDLWQVSVVELVGASVSTRYTVITTTPSVQLDPDLLRASSTYALQIRSVFGLPEAASGDFRTSSLPRGSAAVHSTTFKVR